MELQTGRADMVVTGGLDTFNDIFMFMCFCKTPALSPTGHARPFSDQADGTTLGEGLGVVVLKRLEDAKRDGDRVYAVIKSMGSSSDGKGLAIYAPKSEGQAKALRTAYKQARITPDQIELVEAHGTGTKAGDAAEIHSLTEVYSKPDNVLPWCALGSVKSQIGHTKASAGIAGLIKTALALHHKVLPPTIKVERPTRSLEAGKTAFYVNTQPRPWMPRPNHPRYAAVSAFGFGGSNFHCLLEEHGPEKTQVDWDQDIQILPFSSADPTSLATSVHEFSKRLADNAPTGSSTSRAWKHFRALAARQRADFQVGDEYRLCLVVERETTDLPKLLTDTLQRLRQQPDATAWNLPAGVWFQKGEATGKLTVLFPGQGGTRTGMLRDLVCQFPEMHRLLAEADLCFAADRGGNTQLSNTPRLSDLIFPHPAFSQEEADAHDQALRATDVAQSAIGVLSLGVWRVLERFGIQASAFAGHSYGELVALCAAGSYDEKTLHRLSAIRGRLMAQTQGQPGGMLAVRQSAEELAAFIQQEKLDLIVANKNAPSQAILSGPTEALETAQRLLKERKIQTTRLAVPAAFHSSAMAPAEEPFLEALGRVAFEKPDYPVYANTTGEAYPTDPAKTRLLLAGQLARPVEFIREIENLYAAGIRTFVEAGPGSTVTGLVQSILGDRPHTAWALDASRGKRPGSSDLARLLAQLATLGHAVALEKWDEPALELEIPETSKKPVLTIPLCGANHFKPKPPKAPSTRKLVDAASLPAMQTPVTASPAPMPQPVTLPSAPAAFDPQTLAQILRATQENMAALQQMQEQTARLHTQYLQGQDAAQQSLQALILQQNAVVQTSLGMPTQPVAPAWNTAPVMPPVPQPVIPQPTQVAYTPPPIPVQTPTPPAVPAPTPVPVTPPTQGTPATETAQVLLAVIAEKTGYPVEMLELDMGLDSDLGIDSIKRVEILSALQERLPGAPSVKPEDLSALQTLRQIVDFLAPQTSPSLPAVSQSVPVQKQGVSLDAIEKTLLAIISEKTGYPVEMLELDMGLDSDLGIDSIKRVEILSALQERMPDAPSVKPEDLSALQTLRQIVEFLGRDVAARIRTQSKENSSQTGYNEILKVLLEIISEKTGYPTEMLELDMGLDSDLGIDSIKRVEILSALQERLPDIPAIKPEELGALQTLRDIATHLSAQMGGALTSSAPAVSKQSNAPKVSATGLSSEKVAACLLQIVSEKTGYPPEMLDLDMGLDSDLGIDSIKRVEILSALQEQLPEAPTVQPDQLSTLQTLGQVVAFLSKSVASPTKSTIQTTSPPEPIPQVATSSRPLPDHPLERGILKSVELEDSGRQSLPLQEGGQIWILNDGCELAWTIRERLCALKFRPKLLSFRDLKKTVCPESLTGLLILEPKEGVVGAQFLNEAVQLARFAAPALRQAAREHGAAAFLTLSRQDGHFGLHASTPPTHLLGGGLAGLAKTAAWEWPEVTCKALDLSPDLTSLEEIAKRVVQELLLKGPQEVGLTSAGLKTLELVVTPLTQPKNETPLEPGDVVLVTGGARGVTAETAIVLAQTFQPTLILLGRSPAPEPEPAWLAGLESEGEIKRALADQAGRSASPKEIGEQYRRWATNREILNNLSRIKAAGATAVEYRSVDVRNQGAVADCITEIRQTLGPIRGLVHGAGVLADRLIEDKTEEQFRTVFETKAEGARYCLEALKNDDLRIIVFFSSSTGRLGRKGQVDYAMANEVLNKLAQQEARQRPTCRVLALNWGPWAGGMVNPSLESLFKEEGITLIGLQQGARHLMDELRATYPDTRPVGIVLLGTGSRTDFMKSESTDLEEVKQNIESIPSSPVSEIPLAFEQPLSLESCPILRSHILGGKAVLPAALMIEWLAQGALHANPGLLFQGLDDFRVLKGVRLNADETVTLQVHAGKTRKINGIFLVETELRSQGANESTVLHAKALIQLGMELETKSAGLNGLRLAPWPENQTIYGGKNLFHGPDLAFIQSVEGCGTDGIRLQARSSAKPANWFKTPLRSTWISDPALLDTVFQALILWSVQATGHPSLPVRVERYRQFRSTFPADGVQIVAKVRSANEHKALSDIELLDKTSSTLLARIEGYECVMDASLIQAFQAHSL
ncbi:MAG TPA: SDR family NAD(P)-dependent oxidoreductase [Candidatus Sumerlaeota bacterium]|nr:SDR family NAD(P)-dependent oxidoreductase [Candidatus Sumerlaeota bacterium]